MDDTKSPSDRVGGLEHLLARLQTRIDQLVMRAVTQPGYDDEIAGLVLVRDDCLTVSAALASSLRNRAWTDRRPAHAAGFSCFAGATRPFR